MAIGKLNGHLGPDNLKAKDEIDRTATIGRAQTDSLKEARGKASSSREARRGSVPSLIQSLTS